MKISFYVHAWQGLLMFIAGLISIVAACGGYILSGGGEVLLRRTLAKLETGKADFGSIDFNWGAGEMIVSKLSHHDFGWPKEGPLAHFSGLSANSMSVKMDLFPWPPNVTRITVRGMQSTTIRVDDGFFQSLKLQSLEQAPIPPIEFVDCNLALCIGQLRPLLLTGCSGELRRDVSGKLRGNFSLRELNGRPFRFKLESLDDGSWIVTGDEIHVDTRGAIATVNPFAEKFDPVSLVGALFSGELGAEGTITSLRVAVQPATSGHKFSCRGEVGYDQVQFHLPPPEHKAGVVLPSFLSQLLGHDEVWPRWMQVDTIKAGNNGRVSFHLIDNRLDFFCDEGPGSGFTGIRQGKTFPPLEGLKGSVESDDENRPKKIVLRGFFGDDLSFESTIKCAPDKSRAYTLMLEPRTGNADKLDFGKPLWRFNSTVVDYSGGPLPPPDELNEHARVAFQLEFNATHFPWSGLPAGMRDVNGHLYALGRYTDADMLRIDQIGLDDGGELVYGGKDAPEQTALTAPNLGPLWQALAALFRTDTPWKLHDISIRGQAQAQFSTLPVGSDRSAPALRWEGTQLKNWTLGSGSIIHAGLTTDLSLAQLNVEAQHKQQNESPFQSSIEVTAKAPAWQVKFGGKWKNEEGKAALGDFYFIEENVPLVLHPQRNDLAAPFVSSDRKRVNRTTEVHIRDGSADVEVKQGK